MHIHAILQALVWAVSTLTAVISAAAQGWAGVCGCGMDALQSMLRSRQLAHTNTRSCGRFVIGPLMLLGEPSIQSGAAAPCLRARVLRQSSLSSLEVCTGQ